MVFPTLCGPGRVGDVTSRDSSDDRYLHITLQSGERCGVCLPRFSPLVTIRRSWLYLQPYLGMQPYRLQYSLSAHSTLQTRVLAPRCSDIAASAAMPDTGAQPATDTAHPTWQELTVAVPFDSRRYVGRCRGGRGDDGSRLKLTLLTFAAPASRRRTRTMAPTRTPRIPPISPMPTPKATTKTISRPPAIDARAARRAGNLECGDCHFCASSLSQFVACACIEPQL